MGGGGVVKAAIFSLSNVFYPLMTNSIVQVISKLWSVNSFNPLPDDKILVRSKLKQSADDNFEFDENSKKFSKRVENTVDKGEIARYEQFLLFPQCFQKACFPGGQKVSLFGNGLI